MAGGSCVPSAALRLLGVLPCLLALRAEAGQPPEESLYLWIDAHQARVLIGKARRPRLPCLLVALCSIRDRRVPYRVQLHFRRPLLPTLN